LNDEFLWIFSAYVSAFLFGTAQHDQGNDLTVSAWHVLDEILDELRSWIDEFLWIFRLYVSPFPVGTAQQDQGKVLTISVPFSHVLDEIWNISDL
jgi:hypothetical protein